ncbi:hypothetical protein Pan258_53920 [Symmachiella dynata]|uniref:hypothetical protein n=1 Tax=Symmachiella dynata TaxID=2527995 RepID=UPI0011882D85|nr:hypothetical protein [Symmachiella dynata]QDT51303.1 hypothetical protein Pan258_53920 [Symmachiella dynata]
MSDTHNDHDSTSSPATDAELQGDAGTLIPWTVSNSDGSKSHIVHVDSEGITWALGMKKPEAFGQLVGRLAAQPDQSAALIGEQKGGQHLSRNDIDRVTFAEDLKQLVVIDKAGKKQKIAKGDDDEQKQVFEAVGQHLGGKASEEEADAWSIIQGPLVTLAIFAAIGGFFIYFTTISDPNYEATGRRSGMKQLMNWLGYTIGPTWASVIVGALVLLIISLTVVQLVKRPTRKVLEL